MLLEMDEVFLTDLDEQSTYWQTLYSMERTHCIFLPAPKDQSISWDTQRTMQGYPRSSAGSAQDDTLLCEVPGTFQLFSMKDSLSLHVACTCPEQVALPRAVIAQKQEFHSPESDLDLQREKQ